jgi:hypothetical protein
MSMPKGEAFFIQVGKPAGNPVCRQVGDVQKHAVLAGAFEFRVDGTGHHITAGQIFFRIVTFHERVAVGIHEAAAFAANRFRDEKILGGWVIEAGGVELDELQVGHGGAGAVSHGDAVAGGDVRVAGVQVDFARAAGGQQGNAGAEGLDPARLVIQHISATAVIFMGGGNQSALDAGGEVIRSMAMWFS